MPIYEPYGGDPTARLAAFHERMTLLRSKQSVTMPPPQVPVQPNPGINQSAGYVNQLQNQQPGNPDHAIATLIVSAVAICVAFDEIKQARGEHAAIKELHERFPQLRDFFLLAFSPNVLRHTAGCTLCQRQAMHFATCQYCLGHCVRRVFNKPMKNKSSRKLITDAMTAHVAGFEGVKQRQIEQGRFVSDQDLANWCESLKPGSQVFCCVTNCPSVRAQVALDKQRHQFRPGINI